MDDYWQMPGDTGTFDTDLSVHLPYRLREAMRQELLGRLEEWATEQELGGASFTLADVACTCEPGEHPEPKLVN